MNTKMGIAAYEVAFVKVSEEMSLIANDENGSLGFNITKMAHNYADNWSSSKIEKFEAKLEKAFEKIANQMGFDIDVETRFCGTLPAALQTFVRLY